ncbi:MAG: metal-dependent hydrolase [Hyphomicrobiaceae bacterium]
MKITWLGHSAFRIETAKSVILIDPFLTGNPTFERAGLDRDAAIAGVTHVALTHGHDDHIGDTVEICAATGATLMAVYELGAYLAGKGVKSFEPMNTGGTVRSGDFALTLVDAKHSSSSNGVYLGNPCGIVLTPDAGPVIYHMGDTAAFPGMGMVHALHAPEIGIVPIGDRFTMGAKQAAYACKTYFDFKRVIPCHYGTFPIIDQTADAFVAEMAGHHVDVPAPGGSIAV